MHATIVATVFVRARMFLCFHKQRFCISRRTTAQAPGVSSKFGWVMGCAHNTYRDSISLANGRAEG
eukprot:2262381-Pyramimonas_sp.AAC.1